MFELMFLVLRFNHEQDTSSIKFNQLQNIE